MATRSKGEGSVFHRKDGRWVAQPPPVNGHQDYLYAKTEREARKILRDAMRMIEEGRPIKPANKTLRQLLDAWLETIHVAPSTTRIYQQSAHRLAAGLGRIKLADLTPDRIERHYATLRGQYAPDTIHTAHTVLRQAMRTAMRWGWLQHDPTANVTPPPPGQPRQSPLSLEETRRLLDAAQIDRYYPLLHLLVTSGIRQGEACGLAWRHVDLERGRISIERALANNQGRPTLAPTKTQSSRRTITISRNTCEILTRWRAKQLAEKLAAGGTYNDLDLVFCTSTGRPLHANYVRHALDVALTGAGLHHIRVHDLRHTAATLRMATSHPKVVQELLGHNSITTTINRYSHTMEAMHRTADDALDNELKPSDNAPTAVNTTVTHQDGREKPA